MRKTLKLSPAQAGRLGGLIGGKATTKKKIAASKRNGELGGRPRKL